jgi:hypothetical protein
LARRILVLTLLVAMELGCGSTWARSSGVEVPLHRDMMGLNKESTCTLDPSEWRKRCNREGFGHPGICPKGCPPSEAEPAPDPDDE